MLYLAITGEPGCGTKGDLVIGRNTPPSAEETANAGGRGGAENGGGRGGSPIDEGAAEAGATTETTAGMNGCGAADASTTAGLLHRYSFDGTGQVGELANDLVGTADGILAEQLPAIPVDNGCANTVTGPAARLDGGGRLVLDGCRGYMLLPSHLIGGLTSVTIVLWAVWTGQAGFERYFDFGNRNENTGQGTSYLALTPAGLTGTHLQILTRPNAATTELKVLSSANMSDQLQHSLAVVFVSASHAELYEDGALLQRSPVTWRLSSIDDVNDLVGRSQWDQDHSFRGSIDELRVYGRALSACEISALNDAGPNGT